LRDLESEFWLNRYKIRPQSNQIAPFDDWLVVWMARSGSTGDDGKPRNLHGSRQFFGYKPRFPWFLFGPAVTDYTEFMDSQDIPATTLDFDRRRRCGFPEVIFGPGKTTEQLQKIVAAIVGSGEPVLATRIDKEQAAGLLTAFPAGRYNEVARTFRVDGSPGPASKPFPGPPLQRSGSVAVISAGTGDFPVAEEARETLDWMGVAVTMIHDVGVAGPHRLPARLADFEDADAIVVVAGMEGALPSVVGGYVACPIIAVPTSIGYGANFGGLSALLSMLNSCANNVAVVNIDAGFKAGFLAGLIATGKDVSQRRKGAKEDA
jgi:pyridinium-3,5-biscarboxylic acid mononucleotide synthase